MIEVDSDHDLTLTGASTFTTASGGTVLLSASNNLNNNAVQTFTVGSGSTVTLSAGSSLNMEATNSYGTAATVDLEGATVNIDASQNAPNAMNVNTQNLNVASGQTLSAASLVVAGGSGGLTVMDNGVITATSFLEFGGVGNTGTITLQGTPQQAITVTGNNGLLEALSSGADIDINSAYGFTVSGSGALIELRADASLNLNSSSTFTTGANGSVDLEATNNNVNNNVVQTFTVGSGSTVTLSAGSSVNMEATNNYGTAATVDLEGVTVNIDASQNAPSAMNVSTENLNVASGQTLSAASLVIAGGSGGMTVTDNGVITATSFLEFGGVGNTGTITLQGTPQQAITVTGNNGELVVFSSGGDIDINSAYGFTVSGSGALIELIADASLNLNSSSTFTTGANGSVDLEATKNNVNNSVVQTFTVGSGSTVTLSAGSSVNMEATNNYGTAATIDLEGATVNIDASQNAPSTMNVITANMNVASGQTLSAASLTIGSNGGTLTVTDNGVITATSFLEFGGVGNTGTITLQGTPQQAITVTGNNGSLEALSSGGDIDINSAYGFTVSGSGALIELIADGNLNLSSSSTFTTGANGSVQLSGTTVTNSVSASVTGGTLSITGTTVNNSGTISDATQPISITAGSFANNGTVAYTGSATSSQTITVISSGALILSGGNGSTTGLFNAGDSSNSVVIDPTTLYLPNGTNQSTVGTLVIDADRIQGDNAGTATLSATVQIQVAPYSTSTVTFGVPTAGTDTTAIALNSPSVQVSATNVTLEQTLTLLSNGSFTFTTTNLTNNGLISVSGTNGITVSSGSPLSVSGSGTMSVGASGLIALNAASVTATQGSFVGPVGGSATNGDFSVMATSGNLSGASTTSVNGSIDFNLGASGLALSVVAGATLSAIDGNITLENDSTSNSASIAIGNGATITAGNTSATGVGTVNIFIDQLPATPTAGSPPSPNTIANPTHGGTIYFNNGIVDNADASNQNNVNANGGSVDFYTNTLPASALALGKNVTINANHAPAPLIVLDSLDLTDPTVTSDIQHDISAGYITGTLVVNGSGVGVSGNFTITSASGVLSASLVGDYINTSAETVNLQGFTTPLTLTLVTGTTHSNQVVINGTEAFIAGSSPSYATLNITSNISGLPVVVIGSNGTLSSDNNLTVTANGQISHAGSITAGGALSLQAPTLTNTGSITAGSLSIAADTVNNGGTISSSAALSVAPYSGASLTLQGTGSYSASGGTISFTVAGANALNINGSNTFNATTAGAVNFYAQDSGGSINFGNNVTENVTGTLTFSAPAFNAGIGTTTVNITQLPNAYAFILPGSSASLVVTIPDNSSFTMNANGGYYGVGAGTSVEFSKTAGTNSSFFNANGADLYVQYPSTAITVDSGVTVASDHNIFFQTAGINPADPIQPTVTINGTVTSSAASNLVFNSQGQITSGTEGEVAININLNADGSQVWQGLLTGTGTISETGSSAAGTPYVLLSSLCCDPHIFNISGSLTANAGANGAVQLYSGGYSFNPPLVAQFADNTTFHVAGGSIFILGSAETNLGNNVTITVDKSSGTAIEMSGAFVSNRSILVANGGTATIHTGGGSISLGTPYSESLTFAAYTEGQPVPMHEDADGTWYVDGVASTTMSTLNLTGGSVSMTTGATIVNPYFTIASDHNISLTSFWNQYYTVNGVITNNGVITTSATNGAITVNLYNPVNSNSVLLNGSGIYSTTGTGTTAINVNQFYTNVPLNIGGTLNFSGAPLTVSTQGAIELLSGATVTAPSISMSSSSSGAASGSISQQDALTTVTLNAATMSFATNGSGSGGNNISLGTTNGTSAVTMNVYSNGAVNIENIGSVNLTGSSSAGQSFALTLTADTNGHGTLNFNNNATITANNAITLQAVAVTSGSEANTQLTSNNQGNIGITATGGGIAVANIWAAQGSSVNTANAGNVTLTATGGPISTGTIWTYGNGATGNAGYISITSSSSINTGDLDTFTNGGGSAGAITLTAGTAITTGSLNANSYVGSALINSGQAGGGGNVSLNSGSSTFSLSNIQTYSYSVVGDNSTYDSAPGSLTFYSSGSALAPGPPISHPSVTFASGSSILVNGSLATPTSPISINLLNNFTLDRLDTYNVGGGPSGAINISCSSCDLVIQAETNTQTAGTGSGASGSITLTASGSITTQAIYSFSGNSGPDSSAGSMTFNSGTSTFSFGNLYGFSNTGAAGALTFYGSGSQSSPGSPIALPSVTLPSGAQVDFSGSSSTSTPNIALNLLGTNPNISSVTTANGGSGNAGSITLVSASSLTVGYIATNTGAGAAGAVSLTAAGALNLGGIYTYGYVNSGSVGAGGNVTLNSGSGTFNLSDIQAFSYTASGPTALNSGAGGLLTFYSSGSQSAPGTPLSQVNVTFTAGSNILIDGNNLVSTSSINFNLLSNAALGRVETQNYGNGTAGNISISSALPLTFTGDIAANSSGGSSGAVTLTGPSVSFTTINAGNSTATLQPNQNEAIAVGGATSSAPFFVSDSMLASVTSGTLAVGSTSFTGGFTVANSINVSGSGAGAYNLVFNNGGNYSANGQTITLGSKSLTVNALGSVDTGSIHSGDSTVSMNGGAGVTISNTVTQGSSGSFSVTTTNGAITINNGVTITAGTINLTTSSSGSSSGTISQADPLATATLNAGTINLAANGSGSGGNAISVGTTNGTVPVALNAVATGTVTIQNIGLVQLAGASSAGGTFSLTTTVDGNGNGMITVGGTVTVSGGTITLQSSEGTGGGQNVGGITQGAAGLLNVGTGTVNLYDNTAGGANGSGNGNIGSVGTSLAVNADTLTAATGGGGASASVYISDSSTDNVTLSGSNTAGSAGTFFFSANNSSTTGILTGASSSSIQSGTVVLNSVNGSIGTSLSSVQIGGSSTTNFTASATNGNVYVNSSSAITLSDATVAAKTYTNGANENYNLTSSLGISMSPPIVGVVGTVASTGGLNFGLAVSPSGNLVYVSNDNGNKLYVVNATTNVVTTTINIGATGQGPDSVAFNPTGTQAFVVDQSNNSILVINTTTNAVTSTIAVGNDPTGVAFNSSGTMAYVTNYSDGTVSVINTANDQVVSTIPVGTGPMAVTVNSAGTLAYVTNSGSSTVSVISTATNVVTNTIAVGTHPYNLALNPVQNIAYVTNEGSSNISIINTTNNSVTGSIAIAGGGNMRTVAFNPSGTEAYVAGANGGVQIIDTASNTPVSTITFSNATGLAVNPSGSKVYVTQYSENPSTPLYIVGATPTASPVQTTAANGSVVLTASTGGIGQATNPVAIQTTSVTANASGDVYLVADANNVANTVSITASKAGNANTFNITTPNDATGLVATGNISAGTVSLTASGTGDVDANLGSGSITALGTTAGLGSITLLANGGAVNLNSGTLTANVNVNVTAATGLQVGNTAAVTVTAGIYSGSASKTYSTDVSQYGTSVLSTGNVNFTTTGSTADISLSNTNAVNLTSFGGDVTITSGSGITLGAASNIVFAQGGNVILNAASWPSALTLGGQITAVGRCIGGPCASGPQTTLPTFQGGGVAIWEGAIPAAGFDSYLSGLQADRVPGGSVNEMGTVNISITPSTTGGSYILLDANGKSAINIDSTSVLNANGSVIAIDPAIPTMNLNGLNINNFGPQLGAPAPPPPPPSPPTVIVTPSSLPEETPPSTPPSLPPGTSPTIIPTDSTRNIGTPDARTELGSSVAGIVPLQQLSDTTAVSGSFVFISSHCQPFLYGVDDSVLFGCGGTEFAPGKDRNVLLTEGRMVAMTGTKVLTIQTDVATVNVPAGSASIVERSAGGVLRATSLSGEPTTVSISRAGQNTEMIAAPGEEVVIADGTPSDEELIPADGVDREPIGGKIAFAGLSVSRNKFNLQAMADRNALLNCNQGSMWVAVRGKVDKVKKEMMGSPLAGPAPAALPSPAAGPIEGPGKIGAGISYLPTLRTEPGRSSTYYPVSYGGDNIIAVSAGSAPCTVSTESAIVKATGHAVFDASEPGVVSLSSGDILLEANKATIVRAGKYVLTVEPGTIVEVANSGKVVKVRDVWENGNKSIHAYAGNQSLSISVGEEVMLAESNGLITQEAKVDPVARRHVRIFTMPNQHSAARSEVSIVSLIQNTELLSHLRVSQDATDKAILDKLVKMAACLAQTTANHGPYSTIGGQ
jgi:YVTN family beta-propeller protein